MEEPSALWLLPDILSSPAAHKNPLVPDSHPGCFHCLPSQSGVRGGGWGVGAEGEAVNQLGNPDCILITNAKHPRAAIYSNGKNQRVPGVQREVNTLQVQIWGRKKKITCEGPGNARRCLC